MRVYYDSSALIWAFAEKQAIKGFTRSHALAEIFSSLTGVGVLFVLPDGRRKRRKYAPDLAAKIVRQIELQLSFVELEPKEIVNALEQAKAKAVQGGRVHDYLHAVAAEKVAADELWTLDQNDFAGLGSVPIKTPSPAGQRRSRG